MTRKPKILLIGHARHGKDTVAEMLATLGWSFQSSSWHCAEHVVLPAFRAVEGAPGMPQYKDAAECFEDRGNWRYYWYDVIKDYNQPYGYSKLAEDILQEHDIYVGMRNRREFEGSMKLFDHVVWVTRAHHLPDESWESNHLNDTDASYIVDNNGTLADLMRQVADLHEYLTENSNG